MELMVMDFLIEFGLERLIESDWLLAIVVFFLIQWRHRKNPRN